MIGVMHDEPTFADIFLKFLSACSMQTQADLVDQLFNRLVTGVTWVDGDLWQATSEGTRMNCAASIPAQERSLRRWKCRRERSFQGSSPTAVSGYSEESKAAGRSEPSAGPVGPPRRRPAFRSDNAWIREPEILDTPFGSGERFSVRTKSQFCVSSKSGP
jgi:hypothetical protein